MGETLTWPVCCTTYAYRAEEVIGAYMVVIRRATTSGVEEVVDGYFPLLDEIENEIDSFEERLLARASSVDMSRLLALRRSLVHIRRAVSPQRELFNQLTHHDFPFV